MTNTKLLSLLVLLCLQGHVLFAQEERNFPDTLHKGRLVAAITTETVFYAGGMGYLQFIWYKDKERVPFHFYNDAAGYLQIDKLGHAMGSYVESYLGYHWLREAGVSKKKALIYGGTLGLVLQTPIEIFDGLYAGWGFSWPDMVANAAGPAIVIGQELAFDEQLVKFKLGYWRSEYAKQSNGYLGDNSLESFFADYNSHTFWLSFPLKNFTKHDKMPPWLCISAGYGANGMFGEFENRTWYNGPLPETERYRQYLLSLDVDWTRIPTNSKLLKTIFKYMFFIKAPSPALEYNTLGKVKGYWLYF